MAETKRFCSQASQYNEELILDVYNEAWKKWAVQNAP